MPRKHGHYGGLSLSKWIIILFQPFSLLLFAHFTRLKIKPARKIVSGREHMKNKKNKTNLFISF